MGLPVAAIPIIGQLLGKLIDKVAKDRVDEATLAELKIEAQRLTSDEKQEDLETFYNFVISYEGAGATMPKGIQYLRASVRPVLTYVFAGFFVWVVWTWLAGGTLPNGVDAGLALKLVFAINLLTLGFWFGEKAIQRSGLFDFLKRK